MKILWATKYPRYRAYWFRFTGWKDVDKDPRNLEFRVIIAAKNYDAATDVALDVIAEMEKFGDKPAFSFEAVRVSGQCYVEGEPLISDIGLKLREAAGEEA